MKNLTEENFTLDEYVFFKMKGYPWWPGYINDIQNINKKKIYFIADSFTNTVSKISDNKSIIKFEENIENITSNAKGKKYINSIVNSIESYFQGKKIPKKYEIIIKELKEGKNTEKNKENINNKEEEKEIKKNKEEKINKKEKDKDKEKEKEENKISNKNNYLLNRKRKPTISNDEENIKKEKKIKKIEKKVEIKETKEIKVKKESPKKEEEPIKKKKVKLEGLEKIKEEIKEKERREEEKKKEQKEKEKNEEKKEKKEPPKEVLNEEIIESVSSSTSENKDKNIMIKSYKNFDFYQIVKYLKRIAEYLDKNQKEGRNSYFSMEDKKNFIKVMEYLNSKEMDDPIQFFKTTNIGNYINYINEKTKIKEFKELTKKFLEINREKIELQLFVENTLDMKDINF